jgi:hypothetical protein
VGDPLSTRTPGDAVRLALRCRDKGYEESTEGEPGLLSTLAELLRVAVPVAAPVGENREEEEEEEENGRSCDGLTLPALLMPPRKKSEVCIAMGEPPREAPRLVLLIKS